MGCFDNTPVENLDACSNQELVAGIAEGAVYACIADTIDTDSTLPALGTASTTLEQLATATGDIAFTAPAGFFKINIQSDTGEVKDSTVGNKGNLKIKSAFDFFVANTDAKNLGYIRQYKNIGMVFLVAEKSGRVRKLGSKLVPVFMETVEVTTGKGPEDDTGMQVTISVTSSSPAPVYPGAITMAG